MAGVNAADKILWMADCYLLAKRFPDSATWLSLLELKQKRPSNNINPLNYWLWMEIWQAAQSEQNTIVK